MGIIIKTVFNNNNWMGKCSNAANDSRLFKCSKLIVDIGSGKFRVDENGYCQSGCIESELCTKYCWESFNGAFSRERAVGTSFFVFPDTDNSLIFWGKSQIKYVDGNKMYFDDFKPLPENKWIRGLKAIKLLGKKWGNGTYRYLDDSQEHYLTNLMRIAERALSVLRQRT
jgi:hypothetical protein